MELIAMKPSPEPDDPFAAMFVGRVLPHGFYPKLEQVEVWNSQFKLRFYVYFFMSLYYKNIKISIYFIYSLKSARNVVDISVKM